MKYEDNNGCPPRMRIFNPLLSTKRAVGTLLRVALYQIDLHTLVTSHHNVLMFIYWWCVCLLCVLEGGSTIDLRTRHAIYTEGHAEEKRSLSNLHCKNMRELGQYN